MPIARSLIEQFREVEAQARELDPPKLGAGKARRGPRAMPPPTYNDDLVEKSWAPQTPGTHAFPTLESRPPEGVTLRRAS